MAATVIEEEAAPCTFTPGQVTGRGEKRRGGLLRSLLASTSPSLYPKHAVCKLGLNADGGCVGVAGPAAEPGGEAALSTGIASVVEGGHIDTNPAVFYYGQSRQPKKKRVVRGNAVDQI